jgi:hypothetical protein
MTGERYPLDIRWTGRLAQLLGGQYHVFDNVINCRKTFFDEPGRADRNGLATLPMLLECHRPLDMIVIMLGTNDLKSYFEQSADDVAANVKLLIECIKTSEFCRSDIEIIVVSPTLVGEVDEDTKALFCQAPAKSEQFGSVFKSLTKSCGVHWIDAANIVHTSNSDGIHWESYQHNDFAKTLSLFIQGVHFGNQS